MSIGQKMKEEFSINLKKLVIKFQYETHKKWVDAFCEKCAQINLLLLAKWEKNFKFYEISGTMYIV